MARIPTRQGPPGQGCTEGEGCGLQPATTLSRVFVYGTSSLAPRLLSLCGRTSRATGGVPSVLSALDKDPSHEPLFLSLARNLDWKPQDPSRSKLQGRRRPPCVRFLYHTSYCARPGSCLTRRAAARDRGHGMHFQASSPEYCPARPGTSWPTLCWASTCAPRLPTLGHLVDRAPPPSAVAAHISTRGRPRLTLICLDTVQRIAR